MPTLLIPDPEPRCQEKTTTVVTTPRTAYYSQLSFFHSMARGRSSNFEQRRQTRQGVQHVVGLNSGDFGRPGRYPV